ncbi:hypothetical protein NIES3275_52810 [Microchaete diplosiphon NIES-3275]|nr:hypothetical protein NIES3275_52810 [Microchaete diplosiphon NIES-3275]
MTFIGLIYGAMEVNTAAAIATSTQVRVEKAYIIRVKA